MTKKTGLILCGIITAVAVIGAVAFMTLKKDAKETFTITFDSKGGSKVESITLVDGELFKSPSTPTKEGYEFVSWVDKNETPILDGALLVCEDITLYATWQEQNTNKFVITFDSKGGSKVESITLEEGELFTAPVPTKEGYEFVSWVDKNETPILDGALLACEDITLYANWKKA